MVAIVWISWYDQRLAYKNDTRFNADLRNNYIDLTSVAGRIWKPKIDMI
jgi:hypothetical protein